MSAGAPERTTVPLAGVGWRVAPHVDLAVVGLRLSFETEQVLRFMPPDAARAIAAALIASADLIEARR